MIYRCLRSLLFRIDAESVHEWALKLSEPMAPLLGWLPQVNDPVTLAGITFPNRIGLAAGFDKNACWIRSAEVLGFGHIEIGAVTPQPQAGHPRPRLFRLTQFKALRNRMGFNNLGVKIIKTHLQALTARRIRIGVNLGKNSDTPLQEAAQDYQLVMDELWPFCDYFSLNISSPNTPGLRSLAQVESLETLLSQLQAQRPLFLKLSPDEDLHTYQQIAAQAQNWGVSGIVLSNTTSQRQGSLRQIDSMGGISGAPLLENNLKILREVTWDVPLIGVGGIFTPQDAISYRAAGAHMVQLYTGLVYAGPTLPRRIATALKGLP